MPFFPAWLQAKGLDSRATGIVLAVPMFIRLISVPSLARLADRRSALRGALIATAFGSAAAYVVLSQANGFVPIVLAVALASLATAPTMPLLDAYALKGLALRGRAYSPVRLWGSVAFVIANFGQRICQPRCSGPPQQLRQLGNVRSPTVARSRARGSSS